MKFSEIELPRNRTFGLFFAGVFVIVAAYFFYHQTQTTAWIFAGLAALFIVLALAVPDVLLPLNKLWMRFGFLLGMIISPIVLGVIFFLLFTPIGLIMRLFGRDELRLKLRDTASHWKTRETGDVENESFKHQF